MSGYGYKRGFGIWIVLAALLSTGCAPRISDYRFADRAPVQVLDDRRPIPVPTETDFEKLYYFTDVLVRQPVIGGLKFEAPAPAEDVNALDQVPASTWYTPRLGYREMGVDEILAGPREVGPPQPPLTVVRAKSGGGNPGFIIADGRGERYLVKFDPPEFPGIETTTALIVNRLVWAFGYNVPEDDLLLFSADELRVDPRGELSDADVEAVLSRVAAPRDGIYRATASLLLKGGIIGPFAERGVRADDPNDRVAHENRRALRGLRVFGAFLNHSGMRIDNTLDVYVGEPGRGYVRHYLLDFGEAFGGHGAGHDFLWDGYRHIFSFGEFFQNLAGLGFVRRDWERLEYTPWKSVGAFESRIFDPEDWKPVRPFAPISRSRPDDDYWAARILAALRPEHIAALVEAARYPEPDAADYMIRTLLERRRKVLDFAFGRVTPVDCAALDGTTIVFTASGGPGPARCELVGADGRMFGALDLEIGGPDAPATLRLDDHLDRAGGYLRVDVSMDRNPDAAPARFHIRRAADGTPRLVGVEH